MKTTLSECLNITQLSTFNCYVCKGVFDVKIFTFPYTEFGGNCITCPDCRHKDKFWYKNIHEPIPQEVASALLDVASPVDAE